MSRVISEVLSTTRFGSDVRVNSRSGTRRGGVVSTTIRLPALVAWSRQFPSWAISPSLSRGVTRPDPLVNS